MPVPANDRPLKFSDVYQMEQAEISKRRQRHFYVESEGSASRLDCVGLALSGGGIRSATFCLGFLQGLNKLKLLRIFDYLSTVSGGGYVGGWWSAWLSRDERVMRRKGNPLLDISNIHNSASLVARIADGADQMSKDLRELMRDNPTYRLLAKNTGTSPDEELLQRLVDQMNVYITTKDRPEPDSSTELLDRVKLDPEIENGLTKEQKAELEKARDGENDGKWENRFRLEEAFPYELRNNFPPDELIEPVRRSRDDKAESSEGSQHAYRDPIHHLRLFANYLTPRKGMLSADTWRAVSVITRNLILTWLILLPVLIALMLLGQAYLKLGEPIAFMFVSNKDLAPRVLTLAPLVLLLSWSVVIAIGWLICNRESTSKFDWLVQLACLLALFLLLGAAVNTSGTLRNWIASLPKPVWIALGIWGATTLMLVVLLWFGGSNPENVGLDDPQWKKDVRRSRFSRAQAKLLVTTAVVGIVLGVSWMCTQELPENVFPFQLQFTIVSAISIAGSIFTAFRARPTAGGDRAVSREPGFMSRTVFAVTPPMVLIVLATSAGFVANWVLTQLARDPTPNTPLLLSISALLFIIVCAALAAFELRDVKFKILEPSLTAALFIWGVVIAASWFVQALISSPLRNSLSELNKPWEVLVFVGSMIIAVGIIVPVLWQIIPGKTWKANLVERLEIAEREMQGAQAQRTRAAVKGIQSHANWTFGLALLAILAALGWSVGSILLRQTGARAPETLVIGTPLRNFATGWMLDTHFGGFSNPPRVGGIFSALILSLASITGGAIIYRLCLARNSEPGPRFKLRWLKDSSFGMRPEAHWVLAALCLIVPIGFVCLSHGLAPAHLPENRLGMVLFPLTLAALLGVLIFLRSLVIEKVANGNPIAGRWSKPLFDWAFARIPRAQKYEQQALRVLAFITILLSISANPVSYNIAPFSMTPTGQVGLPNLILMAAILVIVLPIFGAAIFQLGTSTSLKVRRTFRWNWVYDDLFLWILAFAAIVLALTSGFLMPDWLNHVSFVPLNVGLTPVLLPGVAACLLFVLFEMFWAKGENRRSLWLVTLTFVGFATIFFLGLGKTNHFAMVYRWQVVLGLLSAVIVWVVALGWMVDPNSVSMHQFYKGRLVRAYLGASNLRRWSHKKKEITETVAGDDLLLTSLHNCDRGGAYHLINTTLNLVGGRDLATAQRSASSFTLSQEHCGSGRTDYRRTKDYMSGQLSLGTAVAASGAAVSPNMGSKKPTAALAMLMTLLNVRLGYWAPTPNRDTWRSSQPRLWPFYLLREFFSQTNDVANYCYLTDGGHFDNTGLYSLVERGCRYIVLVDCGADPKPACFQDLGEAIRRCRIDFGSEIHLSLDSLLNDKSDDCFLFGTIQYAEDHLTALKPKLEDKARTDAQRGIIIYVKPAVVPSVTADIRQYAIENSFFPQQTTANQWFDEAQFESYRRLGQFCANEIFDTEAVRDVGNVIRLSTNDIDNLFTELENASKK